MWCWWVLTFIHNYVWIFLFIARNAKSRKFQNEFQRTTKHVFWQDYFLHIWTTCKARHFEHIVLVKWLKYWIFCLIALFFKISKLWKEIMIWFFIRFNQWTCIFIGRGMLLLYKKIEIDCMTLCIPFDSFKKNVV
jgi:hypothetical protein